MNQPVAIPKNVSTNDDLDFEFLRKKGLEYIEQFGSTLWTDYNTHDPGITILELLCYAITDLGYRISTPIENLLASPEGNFKNMHQQFLSAVNILPSKPVTALDYRQLFVHHKGVKNAWIKPHSQTVHINCKEEPALSAYTPFKVEDRFKKSYALKGLNDIYIDFHEDATNKEFIISDVRKLYHENRNLCEDLVNIYPIPEQKVAVCAYIDLKPQADEELLLAKILKAIQEHFAPSVRFYSLQQLFDKGYATDEIFQGPIPFENACVYAENLQGGFTDPEELAQAELRTEIRLSDIIKIIMDMPEVNTVNDISLGNCGDSSTFSDEWVLCIKENHKPVLCDKSIFNFTKGLLPIGVNKQRVKNLLQQMREEEKQKNLGIVTEDVVMPTGRYTQASNYYPIANQFPETYGISPVGLPSTASEERKAQAKQLKGYLLFFEQILASYFAHLEKAKNLLSIDDSLKKLYTANTLADLSAEEKQTYFSQAVTNISGIEAIYSGSFLGNQTLAEILNALSKEPDKQFIERRNTFLDHLTARFAERFSDYVFVMKLMDGEQANLNILKAKARFLEDYKELSCGRGHGFNLCNKTEVWDTLNVSGTEKRIARLAGIKDYSRRNLVHENLEIYQEKDTDGITEYRWRIKKGKSILISSSKHYHTLTAALDELYTAFKFALSEENYELQNTQKGDKTYFNLVDKTQDPTTEAYVVARRIAYTKTREESESKRDEIIAYLNNLPDEEGLFIVENILLRPDTLNVEFAEKASKSQRAAMPDAQPEHFLSSCLDADCTSCGPIDPFSFRVSVILPGWTRRFSNIDFRNYVEKIIKEELPAHVLPRICWIGHIMGAVTDDENDMLQFQSAYKTFLEKRPCNLETMTKTEIEEYRSALKTLVNVLNHLNTIYPHGRLHDCENEETEENQNKIILGRTNLGNL